MVRFRMPGRTEAGDLRVIGPDVVGAFLLSRPSGLVRVGLRLAQGAVPSTEPLPLEPGAKPARIWVDATGAVHVILAEEGMFLYLRPGSTAPSRVTRQGTLFDLLAGPAASQIVVYDPERGPKLLALPQ